MASTYKTTFLGLNRFIGTDSPKMDDINFDNQTVDQKFKEHMESDMHLTQQDREQMKSTGYIKGSYTGDGKASKTITLGKEVEFGIIYADKEPLVKAMTNGESIIWSAVIGDTVSSKGAYATAGGFVVQQLLGASSDGKKPSLNEKGKTYAYIIFPKK